LYLEKLRSIDITKFSFPNEWVNKNTFFFSLIVFQFSKKIKSS
jgi:hypothetical protein